MKIVGIIAEYNPFHNGHLYHINKIKELYPNSLIILVLNGYFLERGIISLESKEEKTKLALKYGVDIVVELPFVFGSNSADIFAEKSLEILNYLHVDTLVFGSECNDVNLLKKAALEQTKDNFNELVERYLKKGFNYPTALNKANNISINNPNDLLGLSYIKTILKNKYNIEPITIQRTNNFHDIKSNEEIVSASNIREKINNNIDIKKYIPEGNILNINYDLYFNLLKYKILTEKDLSIYLTVDEGIENKLIKSINKVNNLEDLIKTIKTKRYTYNKIMRMFNHILIGLTKKDKQTLTNISYIKLLGFNKKGLNYINKTKKDIEIPIKTKINKNDLIRKYELTVASTYSLITNYNAYSYEIKNQPIKYID